MEHDAGTPQNSPQARHFRRGKPTDRQDVLFGLRGEDDYNCSNYNLGRQKYRQQYSSHGIQTKAVNALVLETIKETCNYAVANEGGFKESHVSYRKPRAVSTEQREQARQMMIERNKAKEV